MNARSYLFVPGHRPDRFEKACESGADALILDLEDAVAPLDKAQARAQVADWLSDGHRAYVRINSVETEWHTKDVAALANSPGLLGLVLPKAEDAAVLAALAKAMPDHCALLPLVETARAFDYLGAIAGAPKVRSLLFGTIDFQVDLGIDGDGDELIYFRSQLTLASRLAGINAPVDGVTLSIDDGDIVRSDTIRAKKIGFRGKLCIHPKQIAVVNAALTPSPAELEWATRVLRANEESRGAATTVDGKMVDTPVILRAQDLLARGRRDGG